VSLYFADTSFWVALSLQRDQFHSRAMQWRDFLGRSGSRIVTTEAVLWEWLNALSGARSRSIAAEGYRLVHADSQVEVVGFCSEVESAAVDLYRGRPDKDWSLTDCLSFVVMKERGVTEALTADHHSAQAGFKAVMEHIPGV
jgi:uncharacterized protein